MEPPLLHNEPLLIGLSGSPSVLITLPFRADTMMLHPTEQYGQIVVVSLVYLIFSGWAWAETGLRLMPIPLVASTAPEIFKKPLLLTSIKMRSFPLRFSYKITIYPVSFSNMGGTTVSSYTQRSRLMEIFL
jgi:hypothetical protein